MLALFRNNQITTIFPLALYIALTHGAAFFGLTPMTTGEAGAEGGLLYQALFGWAASSPLFSAIAAAVLVFLQALIINNLADEFRLLGERNWLPGMFYALVAASLPDFLWLTAPLVAATFIPMALRRIFRAYKVPNATALVFDAAFWTAVASLFYPPAVFLLLAAFVGVNIMRSFSVREQVVFLTGVMTPGFLTWLAFFWFDRGSTFLAVQFDNLFGFYHFSPDITLIRILKGVFVLVLLAIVALNYGAYFRRKLIQAQKCISVLYWFLVVAGAAILLQNDPLPAHLALLMPVIGIFLAMSFADIKNRFIAEIFHFALLGFVLFIQFFPR